MSGDAGQPKREPERLEDGRLRFPADVLPWRTCPCCGWKWTGTGDCPMCEREPRKVTP